MQECRGSTILVPGTPGSSISLYPFRAARSPPPAPPDLSAWLQAPVTMHPYLAITFTEAHQPPFCVPGSPPPLHTSPGCPQVAAGDSSSLWAPSRCISSPPVLYRWQLTSRLKPCALPLPPPLLPCPFPPPGLQVAADFLGLFRTYVLSEQLHPFPPACLPALGGCRLPRYVPHLRAGAAAPGAGARPRPPGLAGQRGLGAHGAGDVGRTCQRQRAGCRREGGLREEGGPAGAAGHRAGGRVGGVGFHRHECSFPLRFPHPSVLCLSLPDWFATSPVAGLPGRSTSLIPEPGL